MSDKIALFISVRENRLGYSNQATSGVDAMANNLQYALSNAYMNVRMIQNKVKKERVVRSIHEASRQLEPGGFCLIYFHGHGDSVGHHIEPDEPSDEALVCYDGLLLDDELDRLLRGFHPSTRVMTIMDCCSSNTVIEWKFNPRLYPKIIHVASASDSGYAHATINGGLMSLQIQDMVNGWGFSNYSYIGFLRELRNRMNRIRQPIYIRKSPKVDQDYLRQRLFT
jgi:hypothetical protein